MNNEELTQTIQTKENYYLLWTSEFYDKYVGDVSLESEDFKSIAIGFFVAKGLNLEQSRDMYEYCIDKGKS